MTKTNCFIFLTLLFILESCNTQKVENTKKNKEVDILYEMRIPNTSKVIYSYTDFGEYAFSNWVYGKQIMDSTEKFQINSKLNLPFYFVNYNPKTNEIEGIKLIEINDKTNDEKKEMQIDGINCSIKNYRYKKGSGLNLSYKYREFKETQDSLFFKNVSTDGFGLDFGKNIAYSKGDITAEVDSLGFVNEIKLEIYNEYPMWEMMNNTIKSGKKEINLNDTKFTGKNQTDLPPLSLVYTFNLRFKPDSLSKKQRISNYGIFKKIK